MISIIIPAHNEEALIGNCIDRLHINGTLEGIQVIVVCNGCKDATAEVCRAYSEVTVIETNIPSKINALNIGDREAKYFPRFYLDADIIVDGSALADTAEKMVRYGFKAGAPKLQIDYESRKYLIKNYYKIWLSTPYCRDSMIGSGLYGLTEEGRAVFSEFPNVISDDGYIRLLFKSCEKYINTEKTFLVTAPYDLKGLIKIKVRSHLGNMELSQKYPELLENENINNSRYFLKILFVPTKTISVFMYFVLKIIMKTVAAKKYKKQDFSGWARDESVRHNKEKDL